MGTMLRTLSEVQLAYVLAGLSGVDPRAVKRHRAGEVLRESVKQRIESAERLWVEITKAVEQKAA